MDGPYGRSEYSNSQWLEKQEARSKRSKRIVSLSLPPSLPTPNPSSSGRSFETSQTLMFQSPGAPLRKVIGTLVAVVALIVVGVAVGVTLAKKNSGSSSSSTTSGSGKGSDTTSPSGTVNQTDPNDPSSFVKDPRLKHSFYALAYTPEGSQLPQCGNSLGA